jgi:hypothetical protein
MDNMDKNMDVLSRGEGKSRIYTNYQVASGEILRLTVESISRLAYCVFRTLPHGKPRIAF